MDFVSPIPAFTAVLAAIATSALITWRWGAPPAQGRFATIDGLRGFLAFAVFVHHGCIWHIYLREGWWGLPPSRFYQHLGPGSVEVFFMITGFLFFTKLIEGRERGLDFTRLYVSRFLRLVPLYLFMVGALLLVVAVASHGVLREPPFYLLRAIVGWLLFTFFGVPDINGVPLTFSIVAGVTWSLPYEWFFYFSLPVLALVLRVKTSLPYLLLGAASLVGLYFWQPMQYCLQCFLGGILAAGLVRSTSFRAFAARPVASWLVLALVAAAVAGFHSPTDPRAIALVALAFSLIAGGSSVFGLLLAPVSRTLGEMAYSIYLLHGLFLFVTFTFLIGREPAAQFSPLVHWAVVNALVPFLVIGSFATFRLIEQPAMQRTEALTRWLRARFSPVRP